MSKIKKFGILGVAMLAGIAGIATNAFAAASTSPLTVDEGDSIFQGFLYNLAQMIKNNLPAILTIVAVIFVIRWLVKRGKGATKGKF